MIPRPSDRARRAARGLLAAGCLALGGCGLLGFGSRDAPPLERPAPVVSEPLPSGARCFHAGDVYLAADLAPEDLDVLERRGVDTLIDLRSAEEGGDDLVARADALGLRRVELALGGELPTDAHVDRVLAELLRDREGLVLLVSDTGSRSAIFFAIHRSAVVGQPVAEALDDARSAGMKPGAPEAFVRAQVERLGGPGALAPS